MAVFLASACAKLPPEQEHFAKGYSAYNNGDFTTAVLYLKPLVEAGNPAAQAVDGNPVSSNVVTARTVASRQTRVVCIVLIRAARAKRAR